MKGDALARVGAALRDTGNPLSRGRARCPAHGGDGQNLHVFQGRVGAVVRCYSRGCSATEVMDALGLPVSDLFDEPRGTAPTLPISKPEASVLVDQYVYENEDGTPRLLVERYETPPGVLPRTKRFVQSAWDMDAWQPHGWPAPSVYRLPELRAAIEDGITPIVVEGEKCVHALLALDLIATTVSGGASQSVDSLVAALHGASRIVIWPDHDAPGHAFAVRLADACRVAGIASVILEPDRLGLSTKQDAADWVAAGGTDDALWAAVAACDRTDDPHGTGTQTDDALASVDDERLPLTWPLDALRQCVPPLPAGHVCFVGAHAGQGKTAWVYTVVDGLLKAGRTVCVLPLESLAEEWRIGLAALRAGINPAELLSGQLKVRAQAGDVVARQQRAAIRAEVEKLRAERRLLVNGAPDVSVKTLEAAFVTAAEAGADCLFVDHIDHVSPDTPGKDDSSDGRAVVRALHKLAKRYRIATIATSQLNYERFRGGDPLAKFRPPEVRDLWNPGVKDQVATMILGLYRPVREDLTPADLKAINAKTADPVTALADGRTAVVAMKVRHAFGDYRVGKRVVYGYSSGRFRDLTPEERRDDEAARDLPANYIAQPGPRLAPPVKPAVPVQGTLDVLPF